MQIANEIKYKIEMKDFFLIEVGISIQLKNF